MTKCCKKVISKKNFYATTSIESALEKSEVVIIAVGTPSKNGDIDLSHIKKASKEIGKYMKISKKPITVIVKYSNSWDNRYSCKKYT